MNEQQEKNKRENLDRKTVYDNAIYEQTGNNYWTEKPYANSNGNISSADKFVVLLFLQYIVKGGQKLRGHARKLNLHVNILINIWFIFMNTLAKAVFLSLMSERLDRI